MGTPVNSTLYSHYYSLQHIERVRAHTTIFKGIIQDSKGLKILMYRLLLITPKNVFYEQTD